MFEVRKCPFCNGDPEMIANHSRKTSSYFVFVRCRICGSQGKIFGCKEDPSESDWDNRACQNAVSAWNMRVGDWINEQ